MRRERWSKARARRRLVCGGVATSVLVLGQSAPVGADATQSDNADVEPRLTAEEIGLVDSSEMLDTAAAAEGYIQNDDGEAMGGTVVMYAWPREEALAAMEPGDTARMPAVAIDQVEDGEPFSLKIGGDVDLTPFTSQRGGTVDFTVQAYADTGEFGILDVTRSVDRDTSGEHVFARPGEVASVSSAEIPPADVKTLGVAGEDPCVHNHQQIVQERRLGAAPVTIGTARQHGFWNQDRSRYDPGFPATTAEFSYSQGASSEMETAVTVEGEGWSIGGTRSVSRGSGASVDFATGWGNGFDDFITEWNFSEFNIACIGMNDPVYEFDTVRPTSWHGGALTEYTEEGNPIRLELDDPNALECAPHQEGTTFTRDEHSASEVQQAINFEQFGVGLRGSASTGYTESATIRYKFDFDGHMCAAETSGDGYEPGSPVDAPIIWSEACGTITLLGIQAHCDGNPK